MQIDSTEEISKCSDNQSYIVFVDIPLFFSSCQTIFLIPYGQTGKNYPRNIRDNCNEFDFGQSSKSDVIVNCCLFQHHIQYMQMFVVMLPDNYTLKRVKCTHSTCILHTRDLRLLFCQFIENFGTNFINLFALNI